MDIDLIEELHQKEYRAYEQKILKLQDQLMAAHKETIRVRNYWLQVLEDMQLELEKMQKEANQKHKRKQAQAVTFWSFESIDYLCQCMSMLVLMRLEEPTNIFDRVSKIFG